MIGRTEHKSNDVHLLLIQLICRPTKRPPSICNATPLHAQMVLPNGASKIRLFPSMLLPTNLNSSFRGHIYPKCVVRRFCAFWHLKYLKYASASISLETNISEGRCKARFDEQLYLDVFIKMNGLVVDVVLHEVVIDTWQQRHFWQGEDVHELLHGVTVRALYGRSEELY